MECQNERSRKKGFTVPSKSTSSNIQSKKNANDTKGEIKTSSNCNKEDDQENKNAKKTNVFRKKKLKETEILKDIQNNGNKLPSSLTDQEYEDIFENVLKGSDSENVLKESESYEKAVVKLSEDKKKVPLKIKFGQIRDQEEVVKKTMAENCGDQDERPKKIKKRQMPNQEGKHKKSKEKQPGDQEGKNNQFKGKVLGSLKQKTKKIKTKEVDQQDIVIFVEENNEEEGTWIQCTNSWCNKWRYVPDISDPLTVPDLWECSMNPDVLHKSCKDEEETYDETEQILTKYAPGSLVWVKMSGFPWWPALVESDPDYDLYFELPNEESMNPSKFHVTFFGKRVSRAWIKTTHLLPYTKKMPTQSGVTLTKKNPSLRMEMDVAVRDAEEALSMSLKERLLKYGFSGRFSSKLKSKTAEADMYKYDSEDEDMKDKDNFSENPGKKRKSSKKRPANFPAKTNMLKPEISDSSCLDQHVPDIIQPILEKEISMDFSMNEECDNIKPCEEVSGLKKSNENKDIDDDIASQKYLRNTSPLRADPVPDIDDGRNKNSKEQIEEKKEPPLDLDLKEDSTNSEDKWRFGHFMGHCSDHGSDSDPFDIIED